ncbi:hypothetical protein glysoja_037137 [Glycine soja]|uniref:Uncharacterized protein n=1 Tax=Glycine soja TaxID=3848 RepID=A0A0B2QTL3_GLYSO|nr:hypothetical protein glysoja_037137 [Glycine soja]
MEMEHGTLLEPLTRAQRLVDPSDIAIRLLEPLKADWLALLSLRSRMDLKFHSTLEERYATEHRCGVVVKGPNLSGNISGTEPLKDNHILLKAEALDDSHEPKGKSIANVVLLRGCGIQIEARLLSSTNLPSFTIAKTVSEEKREEEANGHVPE